MGVFVVNNTLIKVAGDSGRLNFERYRFDQLIESVQGLFIQLVADVSLGFVQDEFGGYGQIVSILASFQDKSRTTG